MKWLLALVVATGVAAVVVAVKVVVDNRDPAPANTLACVHRIGIAPIRSSDGLNVMRSDTLAGTLRPLRRWDWGRTSGVLIGGSARDYVVLALWNADSPSLATTRSLTGIYERPGRFPLIAVEAPPAGSLLACALKN